MRFLSILLLLVGVSADAESSSTKKAVTLTPPYFDEWCETFCSNRSDCEQLFGHDFVDLRLRVRVPIDDGGRYLMPGKYWGPTISRQSLDTQFVFDIANAIQISPCQMYVIDIFPEGVDNYWDSDKAFVQFRLFPADASAVAELTKQIQEPNSLLYNGHVVNVTDANYGLVALGWDYSLKLMYSIQIVGGDNVINDEHGRYLNHGSLQFCSSEEPLSLSTNKSYCNFEKYLINDMEISLDLQEGQFIVLFIREADRHSVIVYFRLLPEGSLTNNTGQDIDWVQSKVSNLILQMSDSESPLYSGNVTFKVDHVGFLKKPRQFTKYLSQPAQPTPSDAYERCKVTGRCPRAWSHYNQATAQSSYTFQEFRDGEHAQVPAFLDFEDWRRGVQGWEQSCRNDDATYQLCLPAPAALEGDAHVKPVGAHWSPFSNDALGPSIPTFGNMCNSGLVLNEEELELDITKQTGLIQHYEELVAWIDEEYQYGVTDDPMLRTRKDIRENITSYAKTIQAEKDVLAALRQSQCSNQPCQLLFNTSDTTLTGAINATGVIATTTDGTEVALWAFDSINLDENVNITLTGQRAMALVSRSSVRINTTLDAIPGTLGGFPGGLSVARRSNQRLERVCNEEVDSRQFLDICKDKSSCCPGDVPIHELANGNITSNNVNGPGSPSTRVYLMTIQTSAPVRNEIQSITIDANHGQTLSGGFRLQFNGYTTPFLPYDITASQLKKKIEDSLNPVKRNQLGRFDRTEDLNTAGIGTVDVTREAWGSSGGSRYHVTFSSAVGNIGKDGDSSLLTATNHLVSKGASVDIETVQHGNSIGGSFALQFLGNATRQMPHDVSASDLEDIMLQDLTSLSTAHVLRTDPTSNCNDGYCRNGADRSGGYTWTLTLTTQVGNNSPFSPTSTHFDKEGDLMKMTAVNHLSGCVESECPTIDIGMGHSKSHNKEMRGIDGSKPCSLAFGGAGATYGRKGGKGFGGLPPGEIYGDGRISNLYGGSGGAVGVIHPFQLGIFKEARFRGGSGGGAIEVVATNDIIIGSNAALLCEGESGADGYMSAGGGGSGGSILLSAGGAIQVDGKLSASGGDGGHKKSITPQHVESFGGHGGGGSGGRIAFFGQSVMLGDISNISLEGGNCSAVITTLHNCTGEEGSFFIESALDAALTVDRSNGAEGTRSSLYLRPRTMRPPLIAQTLSSTRSGPEYDLGRSVRPNRVTFYFRVETPTDNNWDATFELRQSRWSYLASKTNVNYTAVVGIVIGNEIRHGTNYFAMPFDDEHIKHLNTIKSSVESKTWTKVDIRFNWQEYTHDVYVDDVRVVFASQYQGESIRALSVGNYYEGGKVWFDEVYVGEDTTLDFRCPVVQPDGTYQMDRPLQKGWKLEDIGDTSSLKPMQRHESHVSRRNMYQREDNKFVVPFDGQGENSFTSDVKFRSQDGDRIHEKGQVLAGSLLRLPRTYVLDDNGDMRSNSHGIYPSTYMWYGEHDHLDDPREVSGAVMACSTQDFMTWKNEGAMLHYSNLTDMVNGHLTGPLHVEKPKVLFNNNTKQYVMWMILDNGTRELGMAGVAISDYPNGPFTFVRSFYPDGNQTRDQTLFQDDDGTAYLFRTYYDTVEYTLPQSVMQPTWESVKNADGSTNFALSFHRAAYEPGYDDYHDTYLQRWRTEDQPWKVICVDRLTKQEREVPYGEKNLDGDVCQDPFEYKKVLGQGNPTYENSKNGIPSRFLDPNDPANNARIPNSVPGVKAQTWKENYENGTCGKRKINDDLELYDPNLPFREVPDRGNCSNIVDNPIHPTLPDKRIGPQTVIERRRSKYIAISRLTDDYLDTTGHVHAVEGELEGLDLLTLVREDQSPRILDIFGFRPDDNDDIGSTFQPQKHDNLFSQERDWEDDANLLEPNNFKP